ncbi:Nucleolar protein 12 [Emmonsiellopsis sp. PD_33]|nr:Nucleolar protein 12 [Emmonsiellopsis sp. PD_33]
MGKKSKSHAKTAVVAEETPANPAAAEAPSSFLFGGTKDVAVDPLLASLFEKSSGPVQAPQFTSSGLGLTAVVSKKRADRASGKEAVEDQESGTSDEEEPGHEESASESGDEEMLDADDEVADIDTTTSVQEKGRKRKRGSAEDLEESYMRRVAKEEAKEDEKRQVEKAKRRKVVAAVGGEESDSDEAASEEEPSSSEDEDGPPPLHESLSNKPDAEIIDKSARTVFLSNVSTEAIKSKSGKKTLLKHLSSFIPSLPESPTPHKIESIRFRSTAFSSASLPKRAAYAKRELMDTTTRSTNAYVVYTTATAARKAPDALNGTVVLDRHLRVDSVAHPAPIDNKRCIFVGNLGFVDEETPADEKDEEKRKKKGTPPADVEEGLWRIFNEHTAKSIHKFKPKKNSKDTTTTTAAADLGPVESVRVVRDPATRIGKGFAYVQFRDENAVEAALLLDGQKFPPMLPRKLRVTRAKRVMKKPTTSSSSGNPNKSALGARRGGAPGPRSEKMASFHGRAAGLLGKAGASKLRDSSSRRPARAEKGRKSDGGAGGGDGPLVFEGHRATAENGPGFNLKTKSRGAKGRVGKPKTRSTRRAAAFRAGGGKKGEGEGKGE